METWTIQIHGLEVRNQRPDRSLVDARSTGYDVEMIKVVQHPKTWLMDSGDHLTKEILISCNQEDYFRLVKKKYICSPFCHSWRFRVTGQRTAN